MSPVMRPARPRGLAALRTRFSGWLRRATLALVILPLMALAGSISSETQPELAKQAFVDKAYWEAIRICCNSEIGGFVMRMDCPLDGIGGATERSPTDPALGANSKVTGKSLG